ncbi:hypothetical protein D3870_17960 [Noviherbaspirillum cavernae]|uniref:Uncharacterized protein n=1 Tax=Noviherbaspirillum cavernae TaxID=2320862 RepID=A0A418X587_9BURK|nr:DUF2235 domain-containing protein [Noviherbaspirillum cavernae]RJG07632.1 hypothetical protein D3870_17960 [Noviherbaspirillum cavernae]
MTAYLAASYPSKAIDPANKEQFFEEKKEIPTINEFIHARECSDHTAFPPSCDVNLFFGVFFDGTNNNLKRDEKEHVHSNVARLFRAFPNNGNNDEPRGDGWSDPGKYYNFYRTYVPELERKPCDRTRNPNPFKHLCN